MWRVVCTRDLLHGCLCSVEGVALVSILCPGSFLAAQPHSLFRSSYPGKAQVDHAYRALPSLVVLSSLTSHVVSGRCDVSECFVFFSLLAAQSTLVFSFLVSKKGAVVPLHTLHCHRRPSFYHLSLAPPVVHHGFQIYTQLVSTPAHSFTTSVPPKKDVYSKVIFTVHRLHYPRQHPSLSRVSAQCC